MSDLTRRNVLKATGLTFCSAFIGTGCLACVFYTQQRRIGRINVVF